MTLFFSHVLMNSNMHDTTISIKIGMKYMEFICLRYMLHGT